eukprot:5280155-Amphidinium_carterae.1
MGPRQMEQSFETTSFQHPVRQSTNAASRARHLQFQSQIGTLHNIGAVINVNDAPPRVTKSSVQSSWTRVLHCSVSVPKILQNLSTCANDTDD